MKLFLTIALCFAIFSYASAQVPDGFVPIGDSEKPSLQNVLVACIQGTLSIARKKPELSIGNSNFHVDDIIGFYRRISKDGITYWTLATVVDNNNENNRAKVDCALHHSAVDGKFSLIRAVTTQ